MYRIPPIWWYPFLIVRDTVAENLIISHRVAPLAAAIGGVAQEGVKRTISENSKQCICGHKYPKPPIPAEAEMGGFLLVEAKPQSPETQDKSCGHAIFQIALYGQLIAAPLFFLSRIPKFPYLESYRRWLWHSAILAFSPGLFYSLNTWIFFGPSALNTQIAGF